MIPQGGIVDELAKQTVITACDIIGPGDNNLRIKDLRTRSKSRHEKTCLWGYRPGTTLTGLYSHRRWLEA